MNLNLNSIRRADGPTNIILATDFYKIAHPSMMNPGLTELVSYKEFRKTGDPVVDAEPIVFVGVQPILATIAANPITEAMLDEAIVFMAARNSLHHLDVEMWQYIIDTYNGKLPVLISALREGTVVTRGVAVLRITSLDERCPTLGQHLETMLMRLYYPTVVATKNMRIKSVIQYYLAKSGSTADIDFMLHGFGSRSVTCQQQAEIGGLATLFTTKGDDTLDGEIGLVKYYGESGRGRLQSVYATEHAVAMSFGPGMREFLYLDHQLKQANSDEPISIVCDSYNWERFVDVVVRRFKDEIIARTGRFIVRPDSGDFMKVVPRILEILENIFGVTLLNGYKVLNHNVGVIQGDGMSDRDIAKLYMGISKLGWCASNMAVGQGGGMLQNDIKRDTFRSAIKPCVATINNVRVPLVKDPVDKEFSKASIPGDLITICEINSLTKRYVTYTRATLAKAHPDAGWDSMCMHDDLLAPVFCSGALLNSITAAEVINTLDDELQSGAFSNPIF